MKIKVNNGKKGKVNVGKKTLNDIAFSNGSTGPQITFKNGSINNTKRLKLKFDGTSYMIGDLISKTRYYTTVKLIPV